MLEENDMKTIQDISNRKIGIFKNGYTKQFWQKLVKLQNLYPIFVDFDTYDSLETALKNKEIDAMATLMKHPNKYIMKLSYDVKMKIIPWSVSDSYVVDLLTHQFVGLKSTTIQLKNYRYTDFVTEFTTLGLSLSLFAKKSLPVHIVEDITSVVFNPRGVIRSLALGGSSYIPYHPGTLAWLKKKGYVSTTTNVEEHPACVLMAGKGECDGSAKTYAINHYDNTIAWRNPQNIDQSAVSFLKHTASGIHHPVYGNDYKKVLDQGYMCFEDMMKRTKKTCEDAGMTWDMPCFKNDQCPFFQANTNYPNTFGKCVSGFCEMPLGVKSKGYRKYDTSTKPICHNCDYDDPFCCTKTGLMASPDYRI